MTMLHPAFNNNQNTDASSPQATQQTSASDLAAAISG